MGIHLTFQDLQIFFIIVLAIGRDFNVMLQLDMDLLFLYIFISYIYYLHIVLYYH